MYHLRGRPSVSASFRLDSLREAFACFCLSTCVTSIRYLFVLPQLSLLTSVGDLFGIQNTKSQCLNPSKRQRGRWTQRVWRQAAPGQTRKHEHGFRNFNIAIRKWNSQKTFNLIQIVKELHGGVSLQIRPPMTQSNWCNFSVVLLSEWLRTKCDGVVIFAGERLPLRSSVSCAAS